MPELLHALSECSDTTPGPDGIPYIFLRHLHERAVQYLLNLFNQFWESHFVPPSWLHAYTIPVPKPGKDPTSPVNYRPIVLTSCVCKLFEKMVNPRLMHYAEEHELLSPYQNGSRPEHSTLHSLTHLEHQIRKGFAEKNPTVAIFFDITKAYDTTWRFRILKILYDSGMRGSLPLFLVAFLSNRTFQVKIGGHLSRSVPLLIGVPQGSVLSGTLFLLAINDISKCLPDGVSHSLFVDDFAIYYSSPTMSHISRRLNTALANIHNWTFMTGFTMSIAKTKAMVFYKDKRHVRGQSVSLQMGNTQILITDNVKFLGMTFDSHLNWIGHINNIKAQCLRRMNGNPQCCRSCSLGS